ncbi:MAG: hypothetical protein HOJ18_11505 [Rhodospirillaceae bacterium]|nr:hypothetical protein [Rhodospirillaceae bacterium]
MSPENQLPNDDVKNLRSSKEIETHLKLLDTLTPAALGVLAVASGIYTYLGVSSLLEDNGALNFLAATSYSIAVSVGIFIFWSYMMRLLPAMRNVINVLGFILAMIVGSLCIVAMSSWLNAAALAGSAAVEQHLDRTVEHYQKDLERAHSIALAGQNLKRDVDRAKDNFKSLSQLEADGELSGSAGRGAVFRLLRQKFEELGTLSSQIGQQRPLIDQAFQEGKDALDVMRSMVVEKGTVEERSLIFAEASVKLSSVITKLRQLSMADSVVRAADDLASIAILPELDGSTAKIKEAQIKTINSALEAVSQRAETLKNAATEVAEMEQPEGVIYRPINRADAVIKYADSFAPSWAGAVAIDLLPAVLVFMLAIAHSAVRSGRDGHGIEETLTLADLQHAIIAIRDIKQNMVENDDLINHPTTSPRKKTAAKVKRVQEAVQARIDAGIETVETVKA